MSTEQFPRTKSARPASSHSERALLESLGRLVPLPLTQELVQEVAGVGSRGVSFSLDTLANVGEDDVDSYIQEVEQPEDLHVYDRSAVTGEGPTLQENVENFWF